MIILKAYKNNAQNKKLLYLNSNMIILKETSGDTTSHLLAVFKFQYDNT